MSYQWLKEVWLKALNELKDGGFSTFPGWEVGAGGKLLKAIEIWD